ncbi:hypothetical protein BB65665_17297 [Bacillus sp. 916]|nr:hypothetical protein BB65665_17297 [Bacillus sp. 916]
MIFVLYFALSYHFVLSILYLSIFNFIYFDKY